MTTTSPSTSPPFPGQVYRLARGLARHGIVAGHRIALIGPAGGDAADLQLAAALLGVETHSCPPLADAGLVISYLMATDADVLAIRPIAIAQASEAIWRSEIRFVIGLGPVPGCDIDLLAVATEESDEPIPDRSNPALIEWSATDGPVSIDRQQQPGRGMDRVQ
jgi:hypothetical protein